MGARSHTQPTARLPKSFVLEIAEFCAQKLRDYTKTPPSVAHERPSRGAERKTHEPRQGWYSFFQHVPVGWQMQAAAFPSGYDRLCRWFYLHQP